MGPASLLEQPPHPETARSWSGEKLYFLGDDYFQDLLKSIRQARRTLDFETYIFEKGRLGDLVVSNLLKAAAHGVKVRLLVDGIGSPDFEEWYGRRLAAKGVQYRVYRSWKVLFNSFLGRIGLGRGAFRGLRSLWHWGGHRDHRKLCVVDGESVWVGSFNVSDQHLEGVQGNKAWRDTGIALSGVQTDVFQLAFQLAWEEGTRYG
ncbi:MAG TPA: phospholipase D-like domain-containing protein, partial [bacterium]|nr:phospholipase D-like domain-containing protein [bacterium]